MGRQEDLADVVEYFRRQQKEALGRFLRLAEHDVARREASASKIRKQLHSDEGLMLYLRLAGKDPGDVLAPALARGEKKASALERAVEEVATREDLAKWWMLEYVPNDPMPQRVFGDMKDKLYKFFRYVRTDGYNPATNQSSAVVCLTGATNDAQAIIDELSVWLPLIRPIPKHVPGDRTGLQEWAGWKRMSVLEPSLSASGSWSLYFKDGEARLSKTTWGSENIHAKGDVNEVVKKAVEMLAKGEDSGDE